jgi:hypothetical protein
MTWCFSLNCCLVLLYSNVSTLFFRLYGRTCVIAEKAASVLGLKTVVGICFRLHASRMHEMM